MERNYAIVGENMKTKRASILMLIGFFLITISLAGIEMSDAAEVQKCYTLDYGGLLIEVEAPTSAWPGDTINITVSVKASAEIHVDFINVNFSCQREGLEKVPLLSTTTTLKNIDLTSESLNETRYELEIPDDALPGLIYGMIWYDWYIKGNIPSPHQIFPTAFSTTFIENEAYIELKEDFDNLESSYITLESNYTDLQERYHMLESKITEENSATNLVYLFLITTGIFVVTTILLIIRRPKSSSW